MGKDLSEHGQEAEKADRPLHFHGLSETVMEVDLHVKCDRGIQLEAQEADREKREEHKKVAASVKPIAPTVKPLTASVKPLKTAFHNDEHCEHRIELNPNIQYSNQKQEVAAQRAAIVRTDRDGLIQGIVWSEILGKPKAYQRRENVFQRR